MENYIQNIELINKYLDKLLSENEIKYFENRLKNDTSFKEEYEAQVIFLQGLKRQTLKVEIKKAKKTFVRNRWYRYLGFTSLALILGVVGFVYMNFDKPNHIKINEIPKEINNPKVVLDSIISDNLLEQKIVIGDTLKSKRKEIKTEKVIHEIKPNKEIVKIETPKKPSQTFIINSEKDNTINCKEGTKLIINANSFVDQNNKFVNGDVDLNVTEYYKLSDILLANLSTQSHGKLLETGGMLFIEAKKNNIELKLSETSNIEILFPTKHKKAHMKLFTGKMNNSIIDWDFGNLNDNKTVDAIESIEEDIQVPYAVVEIPPVYPGCEGGNNAQIRKCTSEAINKFAQESFNKQVAEELGLNGRQRINVVFKIDKNGDVTSIRSRASHPELEREARRVIALLPKMQSGRQRGKAVSVPYSLPIIFQSDGVVSSINNSQINKRKRDSEYVKKIENKLKGKDSTKVSVVEMNSYILRTSKLRWINCDRFIKSKGFIKYKIKMKDAKGVIRVNMVFKSINSVMPSWRSGEDFDFKEVPKGEDVLLIAIKKDNGKLFIDLVETKTEEHPSLEFDFQEVSMEKMKSELKKLDLLF